MLSNSADRYGLVSRAIHWLSVLLVFALLGVGLYMASLDDDAPNRLQLVAVHKSVGATVLILTLIRIVWIVLSPAPPPPAALEAKEVAISKFVKGLLYLLLIFMPISGWVMSNAGGYPVSVFGLFNLPTVVAKSHDLHELAEGLHEWAAYGVIALVLLHIAGSLKHRILDTNPEADVLRRML